MTSKEVAVLGGGVVALGLVFSYFAVKSGALSVQSGTFIPAPGSQNDLQRKQAVQNAINSILADPVTLNNMNHMKVGGAHGVPANSKTAKPYVMNFACNWAHISSYGDAFMYNYPGLQTDESTTDGLGRDPAKGGGGGDFGVNDVLGLVPIALSFI